MSSLSVLAEGSPDPTDSVPTSIPAIDDTAAYSSYVSELDSQASVSSEMAAVSYARVSQTGTESLASPWSYSSSDTVRTESLDYRQ